MVVWGSPLDTPTGGSWYEKCIPQFEVDPLVAPDVDRPVLLCGRSPSSSFLASTSGRHGGEPQSSRKVLDVTACEGNTLMSM